MSLDDNKALIQRFYDDLFNRGRLALADELVAPGFLNHAAPPEMQVGPDGLRKMVVLLRTAFPDNRHVIEDLVAEDDKVVVRLTFSGTHSGPFQGVPPTGKHVVQEQLHLLRVAAGKGVESWAVPDDLGLLRQLGVVSVASQGNDVAQSAST